MSIWAHQSCDPRFSARPPSAQSDCPDPAYILACQPPRLPTSLATHLPRSSSLFVEGEGAGGRERRLVRMERSRVGGCGGHRLLFCLGWSALVSVVVTGLRYRDGG